MTISGGFSMYDLPALRNANEALVAALRALLRGAGARAREASIMQICGYPLQTLYRGKFTLLGTPCYDVAGCDGPAHRAFIVVPAASTAKRIGDLRGRRFAVNDVRSNTGMNLPRYLFAPLAEGKPLFSSVILTGSHRASMRAVAGGLADAAAIDSVTFALQAEHEPAAVRGLRILGQTSASPSIPFVTPHTTDRATVGAMRRALVQLSSHPNFASIRRELRINRFEPAREADYAVLLDYEARAVELGYPRLA